jgi:PAX-interacting protein 1
LGGRLAKDPAEPTHLVMTRLLRTAKFLQCFTLIKHIVSTKWIVESAKVGYFLPIDNFLFDDQEFHKLFNCEIYKTLNSRPASTIENQNQKIFNGKVFYITPSVYPTMRDITKMIEINGGKVEKTRRSVAKIQEQNNQLMDSYIIISCEKDLHLLVGLLKQGGKRTVCKICTSELVMESILQNRISLALHILKY